MEPPGRRIAYEYDAGGNILASQDNGQEGFPPIAYTKDNRVFRIGDYPVQMDADGNLLYMSDGQTMASYEYDARNRLVKSGKAQYTYDAQGNRISMTWKGKTTRYVINNLGELSRVLMELDGEGNPKATYVYGLGLIGREDAQGNYQSYHSDLRGSTTLLTDEQGMVTDRYTYGLYGELEKHEGSTNQPFQYNGRDGVQTDPNGLYYMRTRYYDPRLKRFLNRDVLRGDLLDGQTLNRYAYVNGDPIRYIDPLGLCKEGSAKGNGNPTLALPAGGQSSFNVGERLVSKNVYENYIKGQDSFRMGAPNADSFFFNKAGENVSKRSYQAAVDAGFTKQNIVDTINWGENELVRITFRLEKINEVVVPGVSKVPKGIGEGNIPGVNELFTGKGYTQNYLGQKGFDEYIGNNVRFTQDDILNIQYLGRIK